MHACIHTYTKMYISLHMYTCTCLHFSTRMYTCSCVHTHSAHVHHVEDAAACEFHQIGSAQGDTKQPRSGPVVGMYRFNFHLKYIDTSSIALYGIYIYWKSSQPLQCSAVLLLYLYIWPRSYIADISRVTWASLGIHVYTCYINC